MGLINYVQGNMRLLPCRAGTENFFIDPRGNVLPCNGMDMGNLHDYDNFSSLWNSDRAASQTLGRRVSKELLDGRYCRPQS